MLSRVFPSCVPALDPGFVPGVLWNRAYQRRVADCRLAQPLRIALDRGDGVVAVHSTMVLPDGGDSDLETKKFVERLVKFLLWQRGGRLILISGSNRIADYLTKCYRPDGRCAFDANHVGKLMFGATITVEHRQLDEMPPVNEPALEIGRHLDGCRIGFDLGGSDRKVAAVIDGEVVFSEEVPWDPYHKTDPGYHFQGICDSLRSAADKMPRVDAIGGSAAGVYVGKEVRAASLFRGISPEKFESHVRRMFFDVMAEMGWEDKPWELINDGEVTALAGSMALNENAVLGISMGTSLAAGYIDGAGRIKPWINELAFVPVDYRDDASADEWSGDVGCGVQYFSQQAVGRLVKPAGIDLPDGMPFPEQLEEVQKLMIAGDDRAARIYDTIGIYFGYAIAQFADFYEIKNLLFLGRVSSGVGGDRVVENAERVLATDFPELASQIAITTPSEKDKRHGQAIAAASLPELLKSPRP